MNSPISSQDKQVLHTVRFGRAYFIKQFVERFARRHQNKVAHELISAQNPQVAIFAFDHIGIQINLRGVYEREELTSTLDWLSKSKLIRGCALDIGANIGNHSLFFARYYEQVLSFEPNPRTYKLLEYNASLANNIRSFCLGLSDHDGKATLNTDPANIGASSLTERPGQQSTLHQEIELKTLDSIDAIQALTIGLIKIDVEGHELEVLEGGKELIKRARPLILFEQHPMDFENGISPVIERLRAMGYEKFVTVLPSPYIPTSVPSLIRAPLTTFLRLLFGLSYKVRQQEKPSQGFYAFIIAIPS
ncbi:MAG: FkbM family methyltransferase [Sulfuriferula multivorans]|uniref:FkbM family methyltransferase n=1 Tax=Sulfuriferula multivorans TaxID=1559896 RepID=A0A7C9P552_9PROT|nr:FkbM family methyltransferase [Sulfuriferula multivorans]